MEFGNCAPIAGEKVVEMKFLLSQDLHLDFKKGFLQLETQTQLKNLSLN